MSVITPLRVNETGFCSICREELAEQVFGHTDKKVHHLFHEQCVRNRGIMPLDCPICERPDYKIRVLSYGAFAITFSAICLYNICR